MDFDNPKMSLQEAIAVIREIDPSAEETNSRRAETLILQAVHQGAEVKFPTDIMDAADVVTGSDFRDCRNELCLRCGQYKTKHLGSCDGCRWEH